MIRHRILHSFKVTSHKIFTNEKGKRITLQWRSLPDSTLIKWSKWKLSVKTEIKIVCHLIGCNEKNTITSDIPAKDVYSESKHITTYLSWDFHKYQCHKSQEKLKFFRVKEKRGIWQLMATWDSELEPFAEKSTFQQKDFCRNSDEV